MASRAHAPSWAIEDADRLFSQQRLEAGAPWPSRRETRSSRTRAAASGETSGQEITVSHAACLGGKLLHQLLDSSRSAGTGCTSSPPSGRSPGWSRNTGTDCARSCCRALRLDRRGRARFALTRSGTVASIRVSTDQRTVDVLNRVRFIRKTSSRERHPAPRAVPPSRRGSRSPPRPAHVREVAGQPLRDG